MRRIIFIMLILSICQGCSSIQNQFGNKQNNNPQNQEENQERESEPIPVSPQHS